MAANMATKCVRCSKCFERLMYLIIRVIPTIRAR